LIDLHRDSPATATAAVNFVRCLISAGGVAAIVPLIEAINAGWAYTFVGLLYVIWMPMIWVIMKWGPIWRAEKAEKMDRKEAEAKAASDTITAEQASMREKSSLDEEKAEIAG